MIKQIKEIPKRKVVKLTRFMREKAAHAAVLNGPLPSDEELTHTRGSHLKMRRVELGLALLQRVPEPDICRAPAPVEVPPFSRSKRTKFLRLEEHSEIIPARIVILRNPEQREKEEQHQKG